MAGDKFKKVQTGAPLEIPSATWNAMLDAARAHVERQHDQVVDAEFPFRQADIAKVRNNSGANQSRFSVLGIDTPIILPADNEREFKNQDAINAKTPSIDDHLGKFVVLLDPIAENRIGRAWCSGICPAKINIDKEWHDAADIDDGQTTLKSKPTGGAAILWKEQGDGEKWAIVRLSNAIPHHFLIKVPHGGIPGSDGDETGTAECELYRVDEDGLIEAVEDPDGETVKIDVRHYGTQSLREPLDTVPQYEAVHHDGRKWILDAPSQTVIGVPATPIRPGRWGTINETRFGSAPRRKLRVFNACSYTLKTTQNVIGHWHEDKKAFIGHGCRCCADDSSSSSGSSSSGSSSFSSASSSSGLSSSSSRSSKSRSRSSVSSSDSSSSGSSSKHSSATSSSISSLSDSQTSSSFDSGHSSFSSGGSQESSASGDSQSSESESSSGTASSAVSDSSVASALSHSSVGSSDESSFSYSDSNASLSDSIFGSLSQSDISHPSTSEPSVSESTFSDSFGSDNSEVSQQSDSQHDDSQISLSDSGDQSHDESGDHGSQSDKSTAIVPASFTDGGFTALRTVEAPEVRFDDVMTVRIGPRKDGRSGSPVSVVVPIDPHFVEVCQAGTIDVVGAVPDWPVVLGASVVGQKNVRIRLDRYPAQPVTIKIALSAIRRGFLGVRFGNRTREQFDANERFLQSAYPGAGQ